MRRQSKLIATDNNECVCVASIEGGLYCTDGYGVNTPCSSSSECPAGAICERDTCLGNVCNSSTSCPNPGFVVRRKLVSRGMGKCSRYGTREMVDVHHKTGGDD